MTKIMVKIIFMVLTFSIFRVLVSLHLPFREVWSSMERKMILTLEKLQADVLSRGTFEISRIERME